MLSLSCAITGNSRVCGPRAFPRLEAGLAAAPGLARRSGAASGGAGGLDGGDGPPRMPRPAAAAGAAALRVREYLTSRREELFGFSVIVAVLPAARDRPRACRASGLSWRRRRPTRSSGSPPEMRRRCSARGPAVERSGTLFRVTSEPRHAGAPGTAPPACAALDARGPGGPRAGHRHPAARTRGDPGDPHGARALRRGKDSRARGGGRAAPARGTRQPPS